MLSVTSMQRDYPTVFLFAFILMMNMRAQHITFNKAIKRPVRFEMFLFVTLCMFLTVPG